MHRTIISTLRSLLLVALLSAAAGADAQVTAVRGVAVTVADLVRATRFYREVLDFRVEQEFELRDAAWGELYGLPGTAVKIARLTLGAERLDLMQFAPADGRPVPADLAANDMAFQHIAIVVGDMQTAYARLRAHSVRHASSAPQRLPDSNPAAGGIEAFYFRDPDGHYLELLRFPAGKGEPRWQDPRGSLFRGLDHTAIVVASGAHSLRFWRDALGLRIAGESENVGVEQEHLNGVFGAHLLITGLRAPNGPGVEFLQYLAPTNGRPAPTNTRPDDLWHWQVEVSVDDPERLNALLAAGGYRARSATTVTLPASPAGFGRARLWRDPDGHAVLVTSP